MIDKPALPLIKPLQTISIITTQARIRLSLLLAIIAAAWIGLAAMTTVPAVVPATAPTAQFSAERAMRDLAVVAAEPHPVGSARQAFVRNYLAGQIRALGLMPEIQSATVTQSIQGISDIAAVQNVLVRVSGYASSRAIVVTGHYDSAPTSPGAADDGSGTVTTLETLRAILSGPQLKNDVIFLFTDGEEIGLAGARAFEEQHSWAKDVGFVLAIEGMSTDGASTVFATSPASGWWVNQALQATPNLLASSLMNDLMWTFNGGTSTDLDPFVANGAAGLAFTNLSLPSSPAYHTAGDSVQNIDPRTVQSEGDYAVSLVRHFGNLQLDSVPDEANAVVFPLFPRVTVHYPGDWALPLALLALVLFVAVVVTGILRRSFSYGGLLAGIFTLFLSLVASIVIVTLGWWLVRRVNPDLHAFSVGGWYGGPFYLLAALALTLAITTALHFFWRRHLSLDALSVGALAWWVCLVIVTAIAMPGFSYVFTWPLLAATAVLEWSYLRPQEAQRPFGRAIILLLPAVVVLVLLAPVIQMLFTFGNRMEGLSGQPISTTLAALLAVPLIGLLLPQIEFVSPAQRRWLPIAALLTCLILLLVATSQSRPDNLHPRSNTLTYWLDSNTGEAQWFTVNDSRFGRGVGSQMDEWIGQFFPNGGQETAFYVWLNAGIYAPPFQALCSPAPLAAVSGSTIQVLSDSASGNTRQLRLKITAPESVLTDYIRLDGSGSISSLAANGTALSINPRPVGTAQITLLGRQASGVTLDISMPTTTSVTLTVQSRLLGLPSIPGFTVTPRPSWMVAAPFNDISDSTIIQQSFTY